MSRPVITAHVEGLEDHQLFRQGERPLALRLPVGFRAAPPLNIIEGLGQGRLNKDGRWVSKCYRATLGAREDYRDPSF